MRLARGCDRLPRGCSRCSDGGEVSEDSCVPISLSRLDRGIGTKLGCLLDELVLKVDYRCWGVSGSARRKNEVRMAIVIWQVRMSSRVAALDRYGIPIVDSVPAIDIIGTERGEGEHNHDR